MKKYSAIALMLAAALTLSACGDTKEENNVGTPSETTPENALGNNDAQTGGENGTNTDEDNGTNTDGDNSAETGEDNGWVPPLELSTEEAIQSLIGQFDADSFTAPDGTEVMLTEATSAMNDFALYFDFAYIRYAEPVYKDTVSNPEIYDFTEYEFKEDPHDGLEQKPFKAVKGDVLENGMTVVEANYALTSYDIDYPFENGVQLEGECTLEGVLFRFAEDDYMFAQDDVLFFPNPTTGTIPTTYDPYLPFAMNGVDLDNEFAFICDGGRISLGNINDMDVDIADLFKDSSYVKVKVTLDGMHIRYSENFGSQCWSTLKSVEKLS